jgi:hypothetical protein
MASGICHQTGNLKALSVWIRQNGSAVLILSYFFVANIARQATEILLLYTPRKSHWAFSKVSLSH